jgi:hypothetical protein
MKTPLNLHEDQAIQLFPIVHGRCKFASSKSMKAMKAMKAMKTMKTIFPHTQEPLVNDFNN